MSKDLISRKALQKAFADECIGECSLCDHARHKPEGCALIDDAPAVDVEPVRHMDGEAKENERTDRAG